MNLFWRALGSALLGACVSSLLVACSGESGEDTTPDETTGMSMAGAPPSGDGPLALNGCQASSYEDLSAEDDERVVQIAAEGLTYTPPCMTIAAGQSVSFEGSLSAHPLAPGNADDNAAGSLDNPIAATSSGNSVEFTFETPGTYPYYCTLHSFGSGKGMAGAVHVR